MRKTRASRLVQFQFSLLTIMVAVAVAGLVFGFLGWLCGWIFDFLAFVRMPPAPGFSKVVITIEIGPYRLSSTSPAFWPVLGLGVVLLAGVLVAVFAVALFVVKAIARRIMRKV